MSDIIDSYSAANADSITTAIFGPSSTQEGFGQCFTGNGEKIVTTRWLLTKLGSPTGNVVAKIWSMTGTFGVNGNVGSVLATSDNLNVATVPSVGGLVTFTFSGANQYVTTAGTKYVTTFEFLGGSAANAIQLSYDGSAATHPGTWVVRNTGAWVANDLNIDLIFAVDGVNEVNLTGVAATPAIGSGTVSITAAVVIGGATEGIRGYKPKRKSAPPPADVWVTGYGAKAHGRTGRFSLGATFQLQSSFPPLGFVGDPAFEIRADLYDEEILKLLEMIT